MHASSYECGACSGRVVFFGLDSLVVCPCSFRGLFGVDFFLFGRFEEASAVISSVVARRSVSNIVRSSTSRRLHSCLMETMSDWACGIAGVPSPVTLESLGKVSGLIPFPDKALTSDELTVLLVYLVVSKRLFDGKPLCVRGRMFIRAIQCETAKLPIKLEMVSDWHRIWAIT